MTTFVIEGSAVTDIPSFYDELNRLFMADEEWRIGTSLDALNDLLYGGIGALRESDGMRIVWRDHEASRVALGRATTIDYYREKLRHPTIFNEEHFRLLLAEAESGRGQTYFDIVLEVFADHPEVELVLG